jgi:rubrerythrin
MMTNASTLDAGDVLLRQYVLAPPLDWDDECERELRLQNDLWNKLVEIERAHRQAFIALTVDDPVVQSTEAAVKEALDELDALKKERAGRRSANRKKGDTEHLDTAIRAARDDVKRCRQLAKEARRAAGDKLKPKIEALDAARFAAVKAARKASGLWWGNYNAVCASYERARKAAIKRSGKLHFRPYHGEGRITNQIQAGITVAELYAAAHSQVSLRQPMEGEWQSPGISPTPGSRRDRVSRMVLTVTIFTRDRVRKNVRWPIFLNRPIPDGAVIKEVVIHRRKVSHHVVWTATFTCRQPSSSSLMGKRVVAIDFGWRRLNNGMRVATVMDDTVHEFLILPDDLVSVHDWLDGQKKHRHAVHDAIIERLRALPWPDAPPALEVMAQWWRAIPINRLVPRHTARLVLTWHDHVAWRPEDFTAADEWRRHDKRISERVTHRSNRAQRERLDLYRKAAKRIIDGAGVVILEDFRLDRIARTTHDSLPNSVNKTMQRNRAIAGTSVLRQWIEIEAGKVGAQIHLHRGVSTWLCSVCGHRLRLKDPSRLHQQCPHCRHAFDLISRHAATCLPRGRRALRWQRNPCQCSHRFPVSFRQIRMLLAV